MAVDKGFLENLQGLTTLKIYQADEKKAREMDEESQRFRQITMKVLTMQLNSTSVMDIVAYGGAAAGMIVASLEFLNGHLSFAGALTIILLASEFFIPLRLLGSFFHIAMNGMAASDKIYQTLASGERVLSILEETPMVEEIPVRSEGEKLLCKHREGKDHRYSWSQRFRKIDPSSVVYAFLGRTEGKHYDLRKRCTDNSHTGSSGHGELCNAGDPAVS